MNRFVKRIACSVALAAAAALPGCAGTAIGADTSCREFLQAPLEEQNAAIARVADGVGARNALTPLGRPNVDYLCSNDQDRTLGEVVESTG